MLHPPTAPSKWLTLVAVCLGLAMFMIDTFVVNVAFPAIGRSLKASLSTAEWTVSGYVLVLGVLPLAMGRLGDLFGRRKLYLLGLVIFVCASAICGLSTDIRMLIAFRVVQGSGAAIMMPGTLSIITHAFPPQQRGLAIGVWGGVSGLGLIAGPILGGLLVHGDSWRWIFWINVPVGIIALIAAIVFVGESRDPNAPRSVDLGGVLLLAAGLGLVMFGLTRANDEGWTSSFILSCFIGGAALVAAFVLFESRVPNPLVNLALFRRGTFVMACVTAFLFSAAGFGSQPFTSLFMQNYMGFSPLEAGLAFIPSTAIVALLMPVSGIMGQRLGHRLRLIIIGGSLSAGLSFLALLRLQPDSTYTEVLLPAFVLRGIGIGLVMSSTSFAVMSAVPTPMSGLASGTLTMFRQIGTAFGVAVLGAVFLSHIHGATPGTADGLSPAQAASVSGAAEHFVAAGDGATKATSARAIVDGYILLAAVATGICVVASGCAVFIRHRGVTSSETVPSPALEGSRAPAAD